MSNKGRDLTKEPLKPDIAADLLRRVNTIDNSTDEYRAFKIMRFTGCHPRAIFPYDYKTKDYLYCDMRDAKDSNGLTTIKWNRPKKRGAKAITEIPKHPEINFAVSDFIKEVRRRQSKYKKSTLYANRLIKEVAEVFNPTISPLTLRHTLAVEMLKRGLPANDVCDILNIAPSTLRTYGRLQSEDRNQAFKKAMGF